MRYELEMDIALPRARVVELFADPDNWPEWQETLISAEHFEGTPGEPGARTRLLHKFGRRETAMVETIESKRLPHEMTCTYEARGAWNRVVNRFLEVAPDRTRWVFESECRFSGAFRIVAFLMPGMFRKASLREMSAFRKFAERKGGETGAARQRLSHAGGASVSRR